MVYAKWIENWGGILTMSTEHTGCSAVLCLPDLYIYIVISARILSIWSHELLLQSELRPEHDTISSILHEMSSI